MNPSFRTIAELFQIPITDEDDLDIDESPLKKKGENAVESTELGKTFLNEGDYETAIQHFKNAIEQRDPNDITSHVDLAGAYDYSDQAPQALRQYEKALRIQEDAVEPNVGISDLYRRYGRYRDAIEKLEKAIELEPANPFNRLKLAETFKDMGEYKLALAAAQGAIAAKPADSFYHYWTGDLLIAMKRYDEALDSLRAAIELSPGDDFLFLRAAVAFWGAGRKAEAVKAARLASDLDPDKHLYHGLIGILLEESGLVEEAKQESARAAKMDRYDEDQLDRLLVEMDIEL